MTYKENYEYWLKDQYFCDATKKELQNISDNEEEIKDRFYKNLDFGTAGLRGILGAGTNRMNIYTVRKATQGFANYLINEPSIEHTNGVAIAYDPRNMSQEFARETALVFNANGIKAYVYTGIRPTPQLSYTVRSLGCAAGVMVTASHNPPEYNGYKVYGADGAQVTSPHDNNIINHVNAISDFGQIKTMPIADAKSQGLYIELGDDIDEAFLSECLELIINKDVIAKQHNIPIIYTPIHGAGHIPVKETLARAGFTSVSIVAEQAEPNGNFPTVKYPNPEEPAVFEIAIKQAQQNGAEVIVGSDPDADRIGVVCKNHQGEYITLNGNTIGILLTEYILSQKVANGTLPSNAAVLSSIVSSKMTRAIAQAYNASFFEVFTGFKHFGELIKTWETTKAHTFIYGFEESYGYMAGTYVRDKDAVGATMLVCEMVAYYKSIGLSLYDALQEIYKKYGYYKEETVSITLKGIAGTEKIKRIMDYFVANPVQQILGNTVTDYRNYNTSVSKNFATGNETTIDFPKSNVVSFTTDDGTWLCVRPSGTEPKLKLYLGVVGNSEDNAYDILSKAKEEITKLVDAVE